MIDTALLKATIAARADEFVGTLFGDAARRVGPGRWRIGSRGSLAVQLKDGALCFYSHEDGVGGDAVALWRREHGGCVSDALRACAEWAGVHDTLPQAPAHKRAAPAPQSRDCGLPYALSDREIQQGAAMARALIEDSDLRQQIAVARGWRAETLRELALEPSLGCQDGRIAFLYESGVKLRWREGGRRMIRWHFGKPWLWRGGFLSLQSIQKVVLTEGESDAIRMIDAGAEADGKTLVVALPSASTFQPDWAAKFREKEVVLAFDDDEAGQKATNRVVALLQNRTRRLRVLNWREVREHVLG